MKNLPLLFLGIFFCIAFSWTGLILSSQVQFGHLQPVASEEGTLPNPRPMPGLAAQGKLVYIEQGCLYCHSQQVRPKGFGTDFERGWGNRHTAARDYILQERVLLGTMRTGPDLADVGSRLQDTTWHYLHLYDPQITSAGSIMPPYRYLFEVRPIGRNPHPEALRFPSNYPSPPPVGHEVIPTDRARALVAYLLSLKLDYELPEARNAE